MPGIARFVPRNFLQHENLVTGENFDLPCFTCAHCGTVRAPMPRPDNRTYAEINAAIRKWWETRAVCRKCMAMICPNVGCNDGCRPLWEKDAPLAAVDKDHQPWLFRDREGFPVDRIYDAAGNEKLVRRNDNGMTQREIARMQRGN